MRKGKKKSFRKIQSIQNEFIEKKGFGAWKGESPGDGNVDRNFYTCWALAFHSDYQLMLLCAR